MQDVCWKHNTEEAVQEVPGVCGSNYQGSAPLCTANVLLVSREGLVGDVLIRVHLGHRNHTIILLSNLGEVRKVVNKTSALEFLRTDFSLFRTLFREFLGKQPLKTKEGWAFMDKNLKGTEAGHPNVLKNKLPGKKNGLAE